MNKNVVLYIVEDKVMSTKSKIKINKGHTVAFQKLAFTLSDVCPVIFFKDK